MSRTLKLIKRANDIKKQGELEAQAQKKAAQENFSTAQHAQHIASEETVEKIEVITPVQVLNSSNPMIWILTGVSLIALMVGSIALVQISKSKKATETLLSNYKNQRDKVVEIQGILGTLTDENNQDNAVKIRKEFEGLKNDVNKQMARLEGFAMNEEGFKTNLEDFRVSHKLMLDKIIKLDNQVKQLEKNLSVKEGEL